NLSNELRAGWTRVRDWREAHAPKGAPNVSVTVTNPTDNGSKRNTSIYMGTEYCSHANQLDQDIFTITDNLTWYKGNHTITFGTHNEFYKMYNVYAQNATGNWSFNSIDDFRNNIASGGINLSRERERLIRQYESLKAEVATYENNIGFLCSSNKKGQSLVDVMHQKMEKLKEDAQIVLKKIHLIEEEIEKQE
ncbi:MAG: hypothetical protein IKV17_01950, partial [Bacteroidaceae bacterium]|nr:hypothetical protein [Bacteroidaceae bacterium]